MVKTFMCWWFGCDPNDWIDDNRCRRCGEDVPYSDLVGDTRHERAKDWIWWWGFRRWVPARCDDCGRRYGDHAGCDDIPF